jgi:hypothetical protein
MTKSLNPDEIVKLIEAEYDYRDFILQVASNNNWVFDWSEYSTAIVNAKKGALGCVSTTLKELEDDRFLIKQSGNRVYNVTTKGREYHKTGKATKESNNPMQINANNVVFANGDISASVSQANDHSESATDNSIAPTSDRMPMIMKIGKYILWIITAIVTIAAFYDIIKPYL